MKRMKIDRNKVLILLIYVASIIIMLWLLFISLKDMITSFNSVSPHCDPAWQAGVKPQQLFKQL